jgi:hypothetical protein
MDRGRAQVTEWSSDIHHPGTTSTGARTTVATSMAGRLLLVGQIALSLPLLVGALLFARSMSHLRDGQSRYDSAQIVWSRLWAKTAERRVTLSDSAAYVTNVAQRFATLPGVALVAYASNFPMFFGTGFGVRQDPRGL